MFGTSSKNHWCRILVLLSMENDLSRSSYRSCSVKKVFLEVSRNSQENTCPESLFNKVNNNKGLRPATLLKKRLFHRCFPVNFAKFLRTPFLQSTSRRLLLDMLVDKNFSRAHYFSHTFYNFFIFFYFQTFLWCLRRFY